MPKPPYLLLFLLCLLAFPACSRQSGSAPEQQALSQSVNELLLPWHLQFARQTEQLHDSIERFCQNPGNSGEFIATRDAWRQTMLSWQNVSIINFGPVAVNGQGRQIQPQSDSRHLAQKVEALLAEETPISATGLAEADESVQGLLAIEYMLFDPNKGQLHTYNNPRACQYLTAAGVNLQRIAHDLYDAWQPLKGNFVATLLSAGASNVSFPTVSDSLAAILSAITHTLEEIKDHKIGGPFGGEPGRGQSDAYQAAFWRSEQSLVAMRHQLHSVRQLFAIAIAPVLRAKGETALAYKIDHHLQQAGKQLKNIPGLLIDAPTAQQHLPKWQRAWHHLEEALSKLTIDVPTLLQAHIQLPNDEKVPSTVTPEH